jgi:hypothetical protein
MPGFYGYRSVLRSLNKHLRRTGKVVSATLTPRSGSAVAYKHAYEWPTDASSGFAGDGVPATHAKVTLWRTGESGDRPQVDAKLTINGTQRQITSVAARLNADETTLSFAVYDLMTVR